MVTAVPATEEEGMHTEYSIRLAPMSLAGRERRGRRGRRERERERGAGPGRRAVIRPPITGENGEFFPRCRTYFNWLELATATATVAIAGVRARTQSRSTS